MKAAVCYEVGKPLVIEEVTLDAPKYREVKVKLKATAICHSDVAGLSGELGLKFPLIGGHESAGIVEEIGPGVTSVKPGDRVVVTLVANCNNCYYCLNGLSHLCNNKWPLITETRFKNKKGESLYQLLKVGSFAEATVVDQSQCIKIPDDMPLDRAALLSCGFITGFGAVVWRAKVRAMQSVVVIGAGGVGLNAVQGAKVCGAYPVIAVDILDSKLEAAKKLGATHVVNSKNCDAIAEVRKICYGRGADYAIITVGGAKFIKQGFDMTGARGMTVAVGLPSPSDSIVSFNPFELIGSERVVTGGYMGSTNLQIDIPNLVELYKGGKIDLDGMITNRYPLDKVTEAIDNMMAGKALRNVLMLD